MKYSVLFMAAGIAMYCDAAPAMADSPGFTAIAQRRGVDRNGDVHVQIDPQALGSLRSAGGPVHVQVPTTANDSILLKLEKFEVLTPQTKFLVATKQGMLSMAAPRVLLLRGEITGETGSHAYIALTEQGGGSGSITGADGRQWRLLTDRIDGKASGLIVRPGPGDAPDFPQFCLTIQAPVAPPEGISGTTPDESRGRRALTVAIDADQKYTQLFDNNDDAQVYIVELIGAVSDIDMRDLGFELLLGFSRIWPNGGEPFSAADLGGFRDYWIANEDMTGLNLVQMFSGRRDLGYGGIAFIASGCSDYAFSIAGFLLGSFPAPVTQPDLGNWDVVVSAHEMGHNLGTYHTHDYTPPIDQCAFGTNERGTIMSYCHTRPGGMLNIDMRFHSFTADVIINNNPPGSCLWYDCNGNGANDAEDIANGVSADSNGDGIPDECQDCNGNGVLDPQEIAAGTAADINGNGIPDACEPDCNGNQLPDAWEISQGLSQDQNGNRIPDECEPDCDANGIADFADIAAGTYSDLDRDSVPDICQDCNGNGIPDWMDVDRQFNMYVGQTSNSVREYHAASGVVVQDLGPGAVLDAYDLTFGNDHQLYVASFGDNRIVKINADTGASTNFVGPGQGGLVRPSGLTFGPDGNLYVASQNTSSIIKYNGVNGATIVTFVHSGSGGLFNPWGLAFGPNGNLFVVSSNNRVLEYDGATGAFIGTFVDAVNGHLDGPRDLVFLPGGELLVTSRTGNKVTRHSAAGAYIGQFNDEYPLQLPWGISMGPNGNIYVATTVSSVRIIEYDRTSGRYIRSFVRADDALIAPTAFAFRPASPNDLNGNGLPDRCDGQVCLADIAPAGGNGVVNVDDLLAIINAWGPCPSGGGSCPADIAPAGGNGTVNVDDLLAVINGWGPCP